MTINQLIVATGFLTLTAQLAVGQANSTTASNNATVRIDTAVQRLGTAFMQEKSRVGLSIGVIRDGEASFYNFGTTEKGGSLLPTQSTIYEIGSISKTVGSLLLAKAVVEKRVRLDDDIRKYLDGAYPNLAYKGKPVQLVHLTNMTSELPDNFPEPPDSIRQATSDAVPYMIVNLMRGYTRQNFFDDLHTVTLKVTPGQNPRHSNVAAQLLGYILEKVYQMPFNELVATHLDEPLTMRTTAVSEPPSTLFAIGYNEKGSQMPAFTMKEMLAAGGLRYSTADMLKYVAHQLNEKDAAVRLSHQITWGSPDNTALALNWLISKTIDSKRRLRQSGGTFGFASYCDLYPDQHLGIILFANESDQTTQDRLKAISEQIVKAIYGEPAALTALKTGLEKRGYAQAMSVVNEVRKRHPELHLTEDYVNEWGYAFVGQNKLQQAIELFKLNVSLFPNNANTYDSLAETYERVGNRQLAIENYKRALVLNPGNTHAAEYLKKADQATSH
ncbi:MAG: class A beta-lactamase-related serine hydrolase [Bacteroidetes bacterium]|nr:class A beta-lactamase-related serine hydrolase [Fibrella sp.]